MPKAKKLKPFTFWCSICKDHFEFFGTKEKDAMQKFHANGHENLTRRRLRKGLVGVYETEKDLQQKRAASPPKAG